MMVYKSNQSEGTEKGQTDGLRAIKNQKKLSKFWD